MANELKEVKEEKKLKAEIHLQKVDGEYKVTLTREVLRSPLTTSAFGGWVFSSYKDTTSKSYYFATNTESEKFIKDIANELKETGHEVKGIRTQVIREEIEL